MIPLHFFQFLLQLWRRLVSRFRRGRYEQEMEEEMRFHLELQIQENLNAGMAAEEARFAARRQFGNQTWLKEASREMWSLNSLESLIQDLRYGARMLRKNPGFAFVAVLTLALGIGATTAIFSLVECILLKPLPYSQPANLVAVRLIAHGLGNQDISVVSPSVYFIFREQSQVFQDIGLYSHGIKDTGSSVNVTGLTGDREPEHVPALQVTESVLPILGITPALGRFFTRADVAPDSEETVILAYGYWSRRFGGDPSVIERTVEVDGKLHTIIGVLPASFHFLDKSDPAMLLPYKFKREQTYLGNFAYGGIARLKPGVTLAQANADVARLLPIVNRSFSAPPGASLKMFEDLKFGPNLRPLKQEVVGDAGKVLWILMGGISLVLIIACANLANLLLVRVEGRRQELAIRAALGASRGRIAAQLFSKSMILAICGGLFGLGLADGALRVLVALAPAGLPRLHEIRIDGYVVLFTLAVSLAASLLFGIVLFFKYAGAGLVSGLREGGRSLSDSRERHRARGLLVIIQVALALVLLVSSGLMIRTFLALTRINPGFIAPEQVQTFRLTINEAEIKDPERVVRVEDEILRKLAAIPGVSSVGLSKNVPMDNSGWMDSVYARDRDFAPGELPNRRFEFVGPGFFQTLGVPLLAGRDYTWSEIFNKVPLAIVSEKFARLYWGDPASALGKQIRESERGNWREVIGVVGDVHQDGVDREAPTSVYWPMLIDGFQGENTGVAFAIRDLAFTIRSRRAGSEQLMNEIRQAVWSVSHNLPLAEINTLNDYYNRSMARTSFMLVMLALAGSMALFLGIVGLYGVIAYSVSQRRREIGIRMALGAGKSEVLKLVIGQGVKLTLLGVAIGLVGALGLTRFLAGLLYGVKPGDPLTLAAVSVLLIAVAFFASYLPARQAARVDPMVALRSE